MGSNTDKEDTDQLLSGEDLTRGPASQHTRWLGETSRERETHIDGDEMDLGVTVLARLGGGHVNDLAWAVCHTRYMSTSRAKAEAGTYS